MASERGNRKDKNQNIQVFVRLRPLNQRERDIKSIGVIEVVNGKEVVVRQSQQTSHTKKFTFDKAFGPNTKQIEVYQNVVSPLIEEVLAGYNCTVFAYGQTGTGKTHTMIGEHTVDHTTWQDDPLAGIVPRALNQLFDELRLSNTEYTVRVSYLELYNEELFDLLSTSEDNSKLRIYEDVTRKGSNIVNGLEEITVYNKNEVYKIMEQGQERKRVASTLMNAQSSRSHTVFTIVVHMKENSPEGEELVKIGKLNLVDLAGSENISKAGSDNPAKKERARECVNINQSLLTLGRVITALVERHPHIPYRESKLTRILQESLGGRTKTSIIATISPGHRDLEETMSTLEYAHRAKNIQNKPEINQKMTKIAILKEYAEEIDRLKRDLHAAREKNGVYLASETFAEMTLKSEEQNKEIQNLILQRRAMEEERHKTETIFNELNNTLKDKEDKLERTQQYLSLTKKELNNTVNELISKQKEWEEQQHLVSCHMQTEAQLTEQATTLLQTASIASDQVYSLHDNVEKRRHVESNNLSVTRSYRQQARQLREALATRATQHVEHLLVQTCELGTLLDDSNGANIQNQEANLMQMVELMNVMNATMEEISSKTNEYDEDLLSKARSLKDRFQKQLSSHGVNVRRLLESAVSDVASVVENVRQVDATSRTNMEQFVQNWCLGGAARVSALRAAHAAATARGERACASRRVCACAEAQRARAAAQQRRLLCRARVQELEYEHQQRKNKLEDQIKQLDLEREESVERLNKWREEERRLFEERLTKHVNEETERLNSKLQQKRASIEEEMALWKENLEKRRLWSEEEMEESNKGDEIADWILSNHKAEEEESTQCMNMFDKEFSEGTSALSIDMEAFSRSVLEIVEHNHAEMIKGVQEAHRTVQKGAKEVIENDEKQSLQFGETGSGMVNDVVQMNRDISSKVLANLQDYNSKCSQQLAWISDRVKWNIQAMAEYHGSARQVLEHTRREAEAYQQGLQRHSQTQEALESKLLEEEFKTYSPTGKTPLRQQFRFPRTLARTSPHPKLLQRYREADCIVIESDEANTPVESDCESPPAEERTFTAPPTPRTVVRGGDLRTEYESNGKENTSFIMQSTKASKLPTPATNKKALYERNQLN